MRIKNTTPYSTEKIKQLIRFVAPPGTLGNLEIKIQNSRCCSGFAWYGGKRILLRFPPFKKFLKSQSSGGYRGYLKYVFFSTEEDIVALIAHELRHVWQFRNRKTTAGALRVSSLRRKALGTCASPLEVDASRYAIQQLRKFRREFPSDFTLKH